MKNGAEGQFGRRDLLVRRCRRELVYTFSVFAHTFPSLCFLAAAARAAARVAFGIAERNYLFFAPGVEERGYRAREAVHCPAITQRREHVDRRWRQLQCPCTLLPRRLCVYDSYVFFEKDMDPPKELKVPYSCIWVNVSNLRYNVVLVGVVKEK